MNDKNNDYASQTSITPSKVEKVLDVKSRRTR